MIKKLIYINIIISLLLVNVYFIYAEEKTVIYSTWEGFEVDKCASIWLIKRFIDKNAKIKFFPKGKTITEGIPFDMPNAIFRRYHNISTFEFFLKHHQLMDKKLMLIGKIIHDIEINTWERKVFSKTIKIKKDIIEIINKTNNVQNIVDQSIKYFDHLYENIYEHQK